MVLIDFTQRKFPEEKCEKISKALESKESRRKSSMDMWDKKPMDLQKVHFESLKEFVKNEITTS